MRDIFLTGHNGFVGKHLHRRLIEMDYNVETDMRHLHTRKYLCVIHLAAKTDTSCDFNADLIESNINLTCEIFKCKSRIIFGSSCSAEFLTNPYAYTKRYGEHLCELHGNAIALRFFNIYGNGASRGIVKYLMDQPDGAKITLRGENTLRDYIHCDDVVDCIIGHICPSRIRINLDELSKRGAVDASNIEVLWNQHMQHTPIGIIDKGDPFPISQFQIVEVGSGIATSTMDVCNLYMQLSGKTFNISLAPPHPSEPPVMFAKHKSLCMSLDQGLRKTLLGI